jgi:hypothetical protein
MGLGFEQADTTPDGRTTKLRIADAAVTEQDDHGENGAITEMSEPSGICRALRWLVLGTNPVTATR